MVALPLKYKIQCYSPMQTILFEAVLDIFFKQSLILKRNRCESLAYVISESVKRNSLSILSLLKLRSVQDTNTFPKNFSTAGCVSFPSSPASTLALYCEAKTSPKASASNPSWNIKSSPCSRSLFCEPQEG